MNLKIQSLSKSYDSLQILHDVSLEVIQGELISITGESGAGKSTLFNLLSGLDEFEEGSLSLGDFQFQSMKPIEKAHVRGAYIGIVFQDFHLVPALSALENVRLVLDIHKKDLSLDQRNEIAAEILKRVGLGSRLSHRPGELSGGEQQRVAIARALVHRPPVVLADEPTGNLDGKTSQLIQKLLMDLCRESNSSLIVITHDLGFAQKMEKTYQLQDGQLHLA